MARRPAPVSRSFSDYLLWGTVALGFIVVSGTIVAFLRPGILSFWMHGGSGYSEVPSSGEQVSPSLVAPGRPRLENITFGFEEIERVVRLLPPQARETILSNEPTFAQFVEEESTRYSVLNAARMAGLADDRKIEYLMQRAAENVLYNSYIQLGSQGQITIDSPSAAAIRRYYDDNQAEFTVEQEALLWQVYIPVPPDADAKTLTDQKTLATTLAQQIRSGKLSFADAARTHSGHGASRRLGGFVGSISVSKLIPEIRDAIATLDYDAIGGPVRSQTGYHIVKLGLLIPAEILPFDQVRERIEIQLRQANEEIVRKKVETTARKGLEFLPPEKTIEQWRLKLLAGNKS